MRIRPRQRGREIAQHLKAEREGQADAQHALELPRARRQFRLLPEQQKNIAA